MLLNMSGVLYTHDPTIVKENGVYYRIQTGRGVPVFKSEDLLNWTECGSVFSNHPQWVKKIVPLARENDFWAPDCVFRNGEIRLYYSVSSFGKNTSAIGMCILSSLNVQAKNFTVKDCGVIICSCDTSEFNAIDPQICTDENGIDYLLFGSFWGGIQIIKLNSQGYVEEDCVPKTIARRQLIPNSIEGGYIYRRNSKFYLFASHDFCCRGGESSYKIIVGVSEKIDGPYIDFEGRDLLEGGGTVLRDGKSFERWAGPGHNSIFEDDDGRTYIVYHAYDRMNGGRACLQIEELKWKDDLPIVE